MSTARLHDCTTAVACIPLKGAATSTPISICLCSGTFCCKTSSSPSDAGTGLPSTSDDAGLPFFCSAALTTTALSETFGPGIKFDERLLLLAFPLKAQQLPLPSAFAFVLERSAARLICYYSYSYCCSALDSYYSHFLRGYYALPSRI